MERKGHYDEFSSTVLYYYTRFNLSILLQMKIAITQRPTIINGLKYDATARGWNDLLPHHTLMPVTNHSIQTDIDFDMLIISGAPSRGRLSASSYL
jgi:hypothetical protein